MKIIITLLILGISLIQSAFAFTFENNVPATAKNQILADLDFIYSIKSTKTSPLHRRIFGTVDGDSYKKFFEDRVKTIGFGDCGDVTVPSCVRSLRPNRLELNSRFIPSLQPQVARILLYFFSVRRMDPAHNFWASANCPQPFNNADGSPVVSIINGRKLAGNPCCDVSEYGAYSSMAIMMNNISRFCSNCSIETLNDAHLYAEEMLKRIIDETSRKNVLKDCF